ncbi:MAG: hypothetical protein HC819_23180 [Cyclobacteriaceae bacterium]|nr:hypothetical protein [Cyclobacteriaceae bacterium]
MIITNIIAIPVQTMCNMLLQKIEELTLYMIQMKQVVEQLKAENELLKQKIEI